MSNLSVFTFENQQVRFVGTAEKPEWVAQDVGIVLEVKNVRQILAKFEEDEKGVCTIYTPGGNQEMLTVTEPGLYRLIFKSRKTIAQKFQRWIFHEVLPAIRKTGSYALPDAETERIKLELELVKAKQHYQETGQAIALSTSPAMLAFIRGEAPLPLQIEHRDRFVDPTTGKEVGSAEGRSLTQLIVDAGLNPKSTRDRAKVKNILKYYGFDYERGSGWAKASYLREYPVLSDEVYDQALRAVVAELTMDEQPNLFVNQFQQKSLPSSANHNSPLKPGQ